MHAARWSACSFLAINRDETVSVLLLEKNSRMALRLSQRACAMTNCLGGEL